MLLTKKVKLLDILRTGRRNPGTLGPGRAAGLHPALTPEQADNPIRRGEQ